MMSSWPKKNIEVEILINRLAPHFILAADKTAPALKSTVTDLNRRCAREMCRSNKMLKFLQ